MYPKQIRINNILIVREAYVKKIPQEISHLSNDQIESILQGIQVMNLTIMHQ